MDMKTGFARRLAQALAADDRLEGDVADAAGVLASQLSSWKKGASPKTDHIEGLVRALGINGHWLVTGDGTMELPSTDDAYRLEVIRMTASGDIPLARLRLLLDGPDLAEGVQRVAAAKAARKESPDKPSGRRGRRNQS